MDIKNIQSLFSNDFDVYKNTLLENQKILIEKKDKENIFISALEVDALSKKLEELKNLARNKHPLLGVPFAVKDNIDVAGFPTTAGCKAYAYTPKKSAFSVQQLEKAGAICIGKTNMDQFATGLVGTRSPYGVATNYFHAAYIPGGSSSGSASSLTAKYVPFSLGTDTAGSGRVPAAFQNLVGVKPSCGIISTAGVVPACKSLDCVSVFTTNIADANLVLDSMAEYDNQDAYSRKNIQLPAPEKVKIAVPIAENLKFFGNEAYEKAYNSFVESLKQSGFNITELDFTPLFNTAKLLYDGPWVAERYHAVGAFIEENPDKTIAVTKSIILGGKTPNAVSYFDAEYKLKAFKKVFEKYASEFTAFAMPTAGTIYTIEEVAANPIELNSNLGYYTNFMNLLDCAALAVPVAITEKNLPFGVTLFAPAFNDKNLLRLAASMQELNLLSFKSPENYIELAVCGAHKRGGSLNFQLTEINAVYKETLLTTNEYRFYALEHLTPVRPGLIKDAEKGGQIEVEIWKVPADKLGEFINNVPEPLCFGKLKLENGKMVTSFLCENYALQGAKEITHLQKWENYLESK
jgi:allophanate hydrolase